MKTLLLPVDFSERSLEAARQAKAIVRHFDSRLIVLNVLAAARRTPFQFEPGGWWGEELQGHLHREFAGTPIEYLSEAGDVAQVIERQARACSADLIVMAGHVRYPLAAFALGSVTTDLLTRAPCPVWISLHNERGPAPLVRRILCAVDFSNESDGVLNWALAIADAFNATCDVVHVWRSGDEHQGQIPEDSLPGAEREAVERIRTELGSHGQVLLSAGELAHAVSGICVKSRADLLVVGRSSAGNEIDQVHSASYTLLHHAPCPVVSVDGNNLGTDTSLRLATCDIFGSHPRLSHLLTESKNRMIGSTVAQ